MKIKNRGALNLIVHPNAIEFYQEERKGRDVLAIWLNSV